MQWRVWSSVDEPRPSWETLLTWGPQSPTTYKSWTSFGPMTMEQNVSTKKYLPELSLLLGACTRSRDPGYETFSAYRKIPSFHQKLLAQVSIMQLLISRKVSNFNLVEKQNGLAPAARTNGARLVEPA